MAPICVLKGLKKLHGWVSPKPTPTSPQTRLKQLSLSKPELVALEKHKIKGAIRTDFVLSAEMVVIILGSVFATSFTNQVIVVSGLALFFTLGLYGLVAAIVKMDDVGLYLVEAHNAGRKGRLSGWLGQSLVNAAALLMHTLFVVGTLAMFLVGGGILTHGWPWLRHWLEPLASVWSTLANMGVWSTLANMGVGVLTGLLVLGAVSLLKQLRARG